MWKSCSFNTTLDGEIIFPAIELAQDDSVTQIRFKSTFKETVWDKSVWYLSPEKEDSSNRQNALINSEFKAKLDADKITCAVSVPFIGKATNTNYARATGSYTYLGLADSGLFCDSQLSINDFYTQKMTSPDYNCSVSNYPNWDPKWFSPLCRPWF